MKPLQKIVQNLSVQMEIIKATVQRLGIWIVKNKRNRRISARCIASIPVLLWLMIHSPARSNIPLLSLMIIVPLAYMIFNMLYGALLTSAKGGYVHVRKTRHSAMATRFTSRQTMTILVTISGPMILILSLLLIDLIAFIAQVPPARLYSGEYTYLTSLYFGAFAVLGFSVSAYVASVRHRSLRNSEKRLEYTQQKDREGEVDKRVIEGVKLLGDGNESVRLGGIYILWEIVKDAVKSLPYLDPRNYMVYYHRYKDDPIIPYISKKTLTPSELKGQKKLKELYLKQNPADLAQINAYKKAFSLHEQILSILCGHIRTRTNSEEYLLSFHPSLAKSRFPRAYAERYDEVSRFILDNEEEPSNEIAILFRLLSKLEHANSKTLVRALSFKMNLASSVLKGIYSDQADLSYANLRNVNFTNAKLNYATFDYSNCYMTIFDSAILNISSFTMSDCIAASFKHAQISNTTFKFTNCIRADFSHIFEKVSFYGTTMLRTRFSYGDFVDLKIKFQGINGLPGFANSTSLEQESIIELTKGDEIIDINPNNLDFLEKYPELEAPYCELLKEPQWRVSINEAKQVHETLMRSGRNLQPGETYSGYRSLEQIKTRDNLVIFHRMFKEHKRNIQSFYDSLEDKDKALVVKMFSDFDQSKKREERK